MELGAKRCTPDRKHRKGNKKPHTVWSAAPLPNLRFAKTLGHIRTPALSTMRVSHLTDVDFIVIDVYVFAVIRDCVFHLVVHRQSAASMASQAFRSTSEKLIWEAIR